MSTGGSPTMRVCLTPKRDAAIRGYEEAMSAVGAATIKGFEIDRADVGEPSAQPASRGRAPHLQEPHRLRQRDGRELFVDAFKTELIADRVWRTRSQLELAVVEYVAWFNNDRLHESLAISLPLSSRIYTLPRGSN